MNLFTGEPQYETFCRMQQLVPVKPLAPARVPCPWPVGEPMVLPRTYRWQGATRSTHALLGATHTAALLVIKDGAIRHEQYWLTGGRDVPWMSFSVGKSFTSALVGAALDAGAIASLGDAVTRYVPALAGTAYDGVAIRDVLQMSSGVRFYEDYSQPEDIGRLVAPISGEGSFDAVMGTLRGERPPGTLCRYCSCDTQALGMVVSAATGSSLTEYMDEKLRQPLGAESPAWMVCDATGRELAFGGLLFTARDYARFGELFRLGGAWQGRQLLSADYVRASLSADRPHLQPGQPIVADHVFGPGYGYQWWLPAGTRGEFSAIGVYNQYIFVDPSRGSVIVKLSANPAYGLGADEELNKDLENIELLRAINATFD